ncbi:MAG: TonB family protein [Proteobacteria bacterium]|nr:TonB family protein [Pseudomonadota bacterium]
MQNILRFSVSAFLGLVITCTLFILMLNLLSSSNTSHTSQNFDVAFSFVKDSVEIVPITPTVKPKLPEPQESSTAPAAPVLALSPADTPGVKMPQGTKAVDFENLISMKYIPNGSPDGVGIDQGLAGTMKSAIAPMYPQKPLLNKTEGWVKVLIQVNEFGLVDGVKVINAKPQRIFNNSAIKAVRKWKFYPKLENGEAIPFQVMQTIEYTIDE